MLHFLCSCWYVFMFLLSSQFYWHIRLKATAYFFDPPCRPTKIALPLRSTRSSHGNAGDKPHCCCCPLANQVENIDRICPSMPRPLKIGHFPGGSGPHLTHCCLGSLHESASQTASRSVQPFSQDARSWPTELNRQTDRQTTLQRWRSAASQQSQGDVLNTDLVLCSFPESLYFVY